MSVELYNHGGHSCILFSDLVDEGETEAVQANQCLIVDHGRGMLLDPGGLMTYNDLYVELGRYFQPKELQYVFASHADPDTIASLSRWLSGSSTRLLISRLWERFAPHFTVSGRTEGRIIGIPDEGGLLRLGRGELVLLPAHFMHAEGNLQVYDPIARILFTGDLGASLVSGQRAAAATTDFDALVPNMLGFHRRYIVSRKIGRFWAEMVRRLEIDLIVPQHGAPLRGKHAVNRFIEFVAETECGVDLMTQEHYRIPTQPLAQTVDVPV